MENENPETRKEGWMPPGKEKAPKPKPATAPTAPSEEDDSTSDPQTQPEKPRTDDEVISPDGEFEPKKEPIPLL
jgi:hypothetical protein